MRLLVLLLPALLLGSCTQSDTPSSPARVTSPTIQAVANSSGEIQIRTGSVTTVSGSLVQPIR